MMKSLIWKDCRLNALILAVGMALWIGPYAFAVGLLFSENDGRWAQAVAWGNALAMASSFSVMGSLVSSLILGANAIASERADRSAEFLAYLPASRGAVLVSKAVVPLGAAIVVWGSNLLVSLVLVPVLGGDKALGTLVEGWWPTACLCVLLFGVAWLASSYLDSPSAALALGLVGFMAVMIALFGLNHLIGSWGLAAGTNWVSDAPAVAGTLCFAAGSWHYLSRVEP
jgi:ABC-type transport system involved in multi-copper enzyme maturation permease subunit